MKITIDELEKYLHEHYSEFGNEQSLFMKLVEEIGELAEILNKRSGRKSSVDTNAELQTQLGAELADVIHYAVAIAAINNIDLNNVIIDKDRYASIKYNHKMNLETFINVHHSNSIEE